MAPSSSIAFVHPPPPRPRRFPFAPTTSCTPHSDPSLSGFEDLGDGGYRVLVPVSRSAEPRPQAARGSLSQGLASGPAPSVNSGTPRASRARALCSTGPRALVSWEPHPFPGSGSGSGAGGVERSTGSLTDVLAAAPASL